MIDLWPESIQAVSVQAPVTILREQAAFLGQRTKNIVTAEVVPCEGSLVVFRFSFYIVGPAIGNYRYRLFTMSHGIRLYPLHLDLDEETIQELHLEAPWPARNVCIASYDGFLIILRGVFAASKTLSVIRSILSLSGVEPDD